jgi:very-short-patch-repair endonuclease
VAGRVDGFAVLARTIATEDLELIARRLPVVMIAGPREIDHLDHVEVANTDGERELVTHLIVDHGVRRFAFVGGPADSPDANARFLGYRQALAGAGLPVADVPDSRGDFTQAGGRDATRRLLDLPLPRALVYANDQMAIGGLDVLERRGVRVPEDVALVGFDGIQLARPDAANAFESAMRAIRNTVPGLHVEPQVVISSPTCWARPDLVDRDRRIVVECESFEWHAVREGFRKDVRRYTLLVAEGWTVLRFIWEDVMFRPGWVRDVLIRAVGVDARTSAHTAWPFAA